VSRQSISIVTVVRLVLAVVCMFVVVGALIELEKLKYWPPDWALLLIVFVLGCGYFWWEYHSLRKSRNYRGRPEVEAEENRE